MTRTQKELDAIDQRAMMALVNHLEPHDCQWDEYARAAQDVVDSIREDIEIRALRKWADALEHDLAQRSQEFEEVRPQDLRRRADELQAELDEARAAADSGRDRG
jgi:hypothetical protein